MESPAAGPGRSAPGHKVVLRAGREAGGSGSDLLNKQISWMLLEMTPHLKEIAQEDSAKLDAAAAPGAATEPTGPEYAIVPDGTATFDPIPPSTGGGPAADPAYAIVPDGAAAFEPVAPDASGAPAGQPRAKAGPRGNLGINRPKPSPAVSRKAAGTIRSRARMNPTPETPPSLRKQNSASGWSPPAAPAVVEL